MEAATVMARTSGVRPEPARTLARTAAACGRGRSGCTFGRGRDRRRRRAGSGRPFWQAARFVRKEKDHRRDSNGRIMTVGGLTKVEREGR